MRTPLNALVALLLTLPSIAAAQPATSPTTFPESRWSALPTASTDTRRISADLEGMTAVGQARRLWVRTRFPSPEKVLGRPVEYDAVYELVGLDCAAQLTQSARMRIYTLAGRQVHADSALAMEWQRPFTGTTPALALAPGCRRRLPPGSPTATPWTLPAARWQPVTRDTAFNIAVDLQGVTTQGRNRTVWVRETPLTGTRNLRSSGVGFDVRYTRWTVDCDSMMGHPRSSHYLLEGRELREDRPYILLSIDTDFLGASGEIVDAVCTGGALRTVMREPAADLMDAFWFAAGDGSTADFAFYVLGVKAAGPYRTAWRRTVFSQPQDSRALGRHDRQYNFLLVDCAGRRTLRLIVMAYLGGAKVSDYGGPAYWSEPAQPGTIAETFVQSVCGLPLG